MQSVSTLMDGELDGDEAAHEITRLKGDSSSRETWDAYHLIGDTMRGGAAGGAAGAPNFCARFGERLALEPTVLAPRTRLTPKGQAYALRAAAAVAAIAVVSWLALGTADTLKPGATSGELAKAPAQLPQVVALQPQAKPPAVLTAQPRSTKGAYAASDHIHEYLLAHQGISPLTAIQGVTPYIRTVSGTGD